MIVSHSSDELYDWEADKAKLIEDVRAMEQARPAPSITKSDIAEWQLDKDGVACKGCAVKNDEGMRYGLVIAYRNDEGEFTDPRSMTRGQLRNVHDFIGFMLEDSEG
jgi:hypothetical protein